MLVLARESLYEVFEDIQPLLRDHYLELARNQESIALNPDWARYGQVEASNALRVFTARDDGALVGYSVFFLSTHPHYADVVLASNDVLFLKQAHRTGRAGLRLIAFSERELGAEFSTKKVSVAWHAKPDTPLEAILRKTGYGVQDIVFTRLLSPSKLAVL